MLCGNLLFIALKLTLERTLWRRIEVYKGNFCRYSMSLKSKYTYMCAVLSYLVIHLGSELKQGKSFLVTTQRSPILPWPFTAVTPLLNHNT